MKEIDITGVLALGNGERCPFCDKNDENAFIMQPGKDFIKHCVEHHPSELNAALFGAKPKTKYWLEKEFVQLIAHISAKLRIMNNPERLADEEYELQMEAIYNLVIDYYNEVMNHESN